MRHISAGLAACLCMLCLTACGPSSAPDTDTQSQPPSGSPQPSQAAQEEASFVPTPSLEVVDTVFYTSDYAGGCIYMAARVKNTGNVVVGLDQWGSSFDVFDAGGALICHEDRPEIAPEVIGAGEYGYLSAVVLDDAADWQACAQVQCNVSWDTLVAIPDRIPLEDISCQEYSGNFYAFAGMLVNDREYDVADVTPVVALFDPQTDAFLGVSIGHGVDSVPGGGRIGTNGHSGAPIPLSAFPFDQVNPTVEAFGAYQIPIDG